MKNLFYSLFIFLSYTSLTAQSFTAKVIDINNNPIPYATIQTTENSGVITNEEGSFTINIDDESIDSISISSLGYTTKTISLDDIISSSYIITLEEYIDVLDQVYVSNTTPNAEDIIAKTNSNLSINYKNEEIKYNLFFRNSSYVNFNTLEFEIEKVSGIRKKNLIEANKSLQDLTNSIKSSDAVHYRDFVADLHILDKENSKLNVLKATSLLDKKRSFSIEDIQEKVQNLFLKYLDTTKTYKIKSGMFKIEDSLAFNSEEFKEENKKEYETNNLTRETLELIHKSQVYEDSRLTTILNSDLYDYSFENTTVFNGKLVYIIRYNPRKSKAKFTGKLYITDEDFAVIKLDYQYAEGKRGQKVNLKFLLGVKYVENKKKGIILYEKNQDSIYQPKYLQEEQGSFFYVSRPLKFIENSKEKTKVGLEFKLEGQNVFKNEIFFINHNAINSAAYNDITIQEKVPYEELEAYNPSIWAKYNALEPLEEMKSFKSEE